MNNLLKYFNAPLNNKRINFYLFVVILFSFAVRTLCFFLEDTICFDGVLYVELTRKWYENSVYPPSAYLPLLPFLMKLGMHLGIAPFVTGTVVNIICGSLLPLIAYKIILLINGNKEISLLGAIILAFNPPMIDLSFLLSRDIIYLFLSGLFLLYALKAIEFEKDLYWAYSGIILSLGVFARYEILEFVALIGIYFSLMFFTSKRSKVKIFKSLLIGIFCFFAGLFLFSFTMNLENRITSDFYNRIIRIIEFGN